MKKVVILSVLILSMVSAKAQVIWSKAQGGFNYGTIEYDTNWLEPMFILTADRTNDNPVYINGGYLGSYQTTTFNLSMNFHKEDLIAVLKDGIEKMETNKNLYYFEIGETGKGIKLNKYVAKSALRALENFNK